VSATTTTRGAPRPAPAAAHARASRLPARPELWALALITVLAALLRFVDLGSQSLWLDEWITRSYTLRSVHSLGHQLLVAEPHPPLYFGSVWIWSHVFGHGEVGLRSLSAIVGTLTVPLAYVTARQRLAATGALLTALLVAVNPFCVWFSQEARPYGLLGATCTLSLLCLLRVIDGGGRRWLWAWVGASALAMLTHFFAIFFVAACGLWLLRKRRDRSMLVALGVAGVVAVAMLALALNGRSADVAWVHDSAPLEWRLFQVPVQFLTGLYGNWHISSDTTLRFWVGAALCAVALIVGLASAGARRRLGPLLLVGLAAVALPVLVAIVRPKSDYLIPRYVTAAFVPLMIVVAAGLTSGRRRITGAIGGVALVAVFLSMTISIARRPELQRPDWRSAGTLIGPAPAARAVVTENWVLPMPLLHYTDKLSVAYVQNDPNWGSRVLAERPITVRQVVLVASVGDPKFYASHDQPPGPAFRETGRRVYKNILAITYSAAKPVTITPARLAAGAQRSFGHPLQGWTAPGIFFQQPS
jgi:uncharacterized membrane protein